MTRRRWLRRGLALLVALGALLAAAHTPPARRLALQQLLATLRTQGLSARAEALDYDLLRLRAQLSGLRLAVPGQEDAPFLTADEVALRLPAGVLLGRSAFDEITARGLRVALRRDRAGRANWPSSSSGSSSAPLPRPGKIALEGSLSLVDEPAGLSVQAPVDLLLEPAGAGVAGRLALPGALRWRVGERAGEAQVLPVSLAFDGHDLIWRGLSLRAPQGSATGEGRIAEVAGAGQVAAHLDVAVDLAALALPSTRGRLEARLRAEGPLQSPRLALDGTGSGLVVAGLPLDAPGCRATLAGDVLSLESLSLRLAGGRIDAQGRLALAAGSGQLGASWAALSLPGLAPATAVLPPALRERLLSGTLDLRWSAPRLPALSGQGRLEAAGPGGSASAVLELRQGRWKVEALQEGSLQLRATAGGVLAPDVAQSTLAGDLAVRAADLDALLRPLGGPPLEVAGAELSASFSGTLGTPRATGELSSQARVQGPAGPLPLLARASFEASPGELALPTLRLGLGSARAEGDGRIGPSELAGRLTVRAADLSELGLQRGSLLATADLSGTPARPRALLKGQVRDLASGDAGVAALDVDLEAAGTDLANAVGGGRLELTGLRWREQELGRAEVDLRLARANLAAILQAPGLGTEARADLGLDAARRFSVELRATDLDLERLAGPDARGRIGLRLAAAGHAAGTPELESATLALDALDATLRGRPLRLVHPGSLSLQSGEVRADELRVALGEGDLALTGTAEWPLHAALQARAEDLAALAPQSPPGLGGALRAWVGVSGPWRRPRVSADVQVVDGQFGENRGAVSGVGLQAALRDGVWQVQQAEARWKDAVVEATGRLPLRFLGLPGPLQEALPAGEGEARLQARLQGLRLTSLLEDPPRGVAGQVDATLEASAARPGLDALRGHLELVPQGVELAGDALSPEGPARVDLAGRELTLSPWSWKGPETDLALAGSLRLGSDAAPMDDARLDATARGVLELDILSPFLPRASVAGTARIDARLSGRPAAPDLAGEVEVRDGVVRVLEPRLFADRIAGRLVLSQGRAELVGFSGHANGGTATMAGALELAGLVPQQGRVELRARGLAFEWPQDFRGEADADLAYAVAGSRHTLSGDVKVLRGGYRRDLLIGAGGLAAAGTEDVLAGLLPGQQSPLDDLRFDVRVRSAEDLVIDTNYGRAGLGLDLRSVGTYARPGLLGRITVSPGSQVYFGGTTYNVESASVDYASSTSIAPRVNATALAHIGGYAVTVAIRGTPGRIRTRLSSDPPLGDRELTALVLTGNKDSSGSVADPQLALALLSTDVLGAAGRKLGLESVRLERSGSSSEIDFDPTAVAVDTNPATRLTAAIRLSPRVRLVYSQNLASAGLLTWIVGFMPRPDLEVRGVRQDDGTATLELRHALSFGGAPRVRGAQVQSPRVAELRFTGEPDLDHAVLRRQVKLREGRRFDLAHWGQDQERLARFLEGLGYLESRVAARRQVRDDGRLDLEYELRRGPRTSIELHGVPPSEALLREVRAAWRELPVPAFLEEEAAARVRRRLQAQGHLRASVRARLEIDPERRRERLIVEVEPGPRSPDRSAAFEGRRLVGEQVLQAALAPLLKDGRAFDDPAAVERALRSAYFAEGLLAARFRVHRTRFDGDRAVLPVTIDEGPDVKIGALAVEGAFGFSREAVLAASGLKPGDRARLASIERALQGVERAYRRAGFGGASLRPEASLDEAGGTLALTLHVAEGPRQTIGEVRTEGLDRISPSYLQRLLRLQPGQPLDPDALASASRRLLGSGAFRGASIEPGPVAEGATEAPLQVRVEEWPPYRLRYGLQLALPETGSPAEGVEAEGLRPGVVADLTRRNLLGRPLQAGLSGRYRSDERGARSWLSAPSFFGHRLRTSGFLSWRDAPQVVEGERQPYRERSWELSVEQRLRRRRRLEASYGYASEWFRLLPAERLFSDTAEGRISRLEGAISIDARDDLLDPRSGFLHSTGLEWGPSWLGSRIDVTIPNLVPIVIEVPLDLRRLIVQQFRFTPAGPAVLASAARLEYGRGNALGRSVTDRLQAGGGNTVRGYDTPPLDLGLATAQAGGSTTLLVLNQEARFPILGWLGGVAFLDHSSLWTGLEGDSAREDRTGAGLGLRVRTPLGLFRVDYGRPLRDEPPGRRRGQFYFGIGHAF